MTAETEALAQEEQEWAEQQRVYDETVGAQRHYDGKDPATWEPLVIEFEGITIAEQAPPGFLRHVASARYARRPTTVVIVPRRGSPRRRGGGRPTARRTAGASARAADDPGEPGQHRPSRLGEEGWR